MSLAKFHTDDKPLMMLQTAWASELDPLLKNPTNNCSVLSSVQLQIGSNVINHKLGRKLQGWSVVRKRAAADVYDTQDSNPTPALTLTLTSSAVVVVDLLVF